jgi:hypothetical protein
MVATEAAATVVVIEMVAIAIAITMSIQVQVSKIIPIIQEHHHLLRINPTPIVTEMSIKTFIETAVIAVATIIATAMDITTILMAMMLEMTTEMAMNQHPLCLYYYFQTKSKVIPKKYKLDPYVYHHFIDVLPLFHCILLHTVTSMDKRKIWIFTCAR